MQTIQWKGIISKQEMMTTNITKLVASKNFKIGFICLLILDILFFFFNFFYLKEINQEFLVIGFIIISLINILLFGVQIWKISKSTPETTEVLYFSKTFELQISILNEMITLKYEDIKKSFMVDEVLYVSNVFNTRTQIVKLDNLKIEDKKIILERLKAEELQGV